MGRPRPVLPRRRALIGALVLVLFAGLTAPIGSDAAAAPPVFADVAGPSAQSSIGLSKTPIPENPSWRHYVLGDGALQARPVRIASSSGAVTNAEGLVDASTGPARLSWDGMGPAPTILLDYGREVGGLPYFDVGAVTPAGGATSVTLRSAYSETRGFMFSATGVLTGDRNGFNGVGVARSRAEDFTLTGPGTIGNAPNAIQGGERFQALTLTNPGTVELTSVGITFRHPNASSDDYQGHFLSSDAALNRLWYQGAYTNDTDMVPIGAVPNQTVPVILDGAKRDRRPWIGDLSVQGRTAFSSLGFGAKGSDYIKGAIQEFGATQAANGSVFGHIGDWTVSPPRGGFYSTSYSTYFVLDLASYYLYSGDTAFAESQYQTMKNELAYNQTLVDPSSGLLITGASNGRDWDFYDGGKPGAVTAYNAIYYKALTGAAQLASELAERDPGNPSAATWQADAATWRDQAATLKERINATLFDPTRGIYKLADRDNGTHAGSSVPQDANSEAITYGLAPADTQAGILGYLRGNLWGQFGPQPYTPDANYSTIISPFVTGFEVDARFAAGDTQGALDLIHLMWDQMTNDSGPYYTGTLWEKLNQDGTDVDANASLSHGWATGPVSSLSGYLVGARPVTAGYKTWIIAPEPGDVSWAQGQIPTPSGALVSRWRHGDSDAPFTLTMSAPSGTSGTVAVPLLGHSRTIAMDGQIVWQDGAPAAGVTAAERDGAVDFSGITGSHTFAWVGVGG
jgi:alpha-L-rhamnosidase